MSQNATGFDWTPDRENAALLVAKDELSDEAIATEAHVDRRQLARWKRLDAFQARVSEHRKLWRDELAAEGLASQKNRLAAYNDRWRRMQQVITERATDPMVAEVAGGTSGLMVATPMSVKVEDERESSGEGVLKLPSSQLVHKYQVDTGLLKELRELEKQAAMDLGQWTEKKELTGKDGAPIAFIEVAVPAGVDRSSQPATSPELPSGATEGMGQ